MAVTTSQVLARARSRIGTVGGGEFNAYIGQARSAAWCAAFASWVYGGLGIANPKSGWTPNWVSWAKRNGRWLAKTATPRPGDAVMYMWAGVSPAGRGTPPVCHIGIVESVLADGRIYTIEGNTSGTAAGSQYNGNLCARRLRNRANVQGFIRMDGAATTATPTPSSPAATPATTTSPVLTYGSTGAKVGELQDLLNRLGGYGLARDNSFGPAVKAALIAYQAGTGLAVDASCGPATWSALRAGKRPTKVTRVLTRGCTGPDVGILQKVLAATLGRKLAIDNSFGPIVQTAVRDYQRSRGLDPDASVGPRTRASLKI